MREISILMVLPAGFAQSRGTVTAAHFRSSMPAPGMQVDQVRCCFVNEVGGAADGAEVPAAATVGEAANRRIAGAAAARMVRTLSMWLDPSAGTRSRSLWRLMVADHCMRV